MKNFKSQMVYTRLRESKEDHISQMKDKGWSRNSYLFSIRERINWLVIVAVIVLGMIISSSVAAQDFYKAERRYFKSRYKTQIAMGRHECALLFRKRNPPKKFPLLKKIPKWKPQAEVDPPGFIRKEPQLAANH